MPLPLTPRPELHTRNFVLMGLVFIVVPFLPSCGLFLDVGFTVAERILFMPRCGAVLVAVTGRTD